MPNTIVLKAEGWIRKEGKASEAITPGHLLDYGGANDLIKHATAAAGVAAATDRLIALEREREISSANSATKSIDAAYATGDQVRYQVARPGDCFYMFLNSGANVAKHARLESAGNGNLQASTTGVAQFRALEAVNATAATARIRVEAI